MPRTPRNPQRSKRNMLHIWNIYIPKDHLTLQWKGLTLYSRGWVLKIASFEGSGSLGIYIYHQFTPFI